MNEDQVDGVELLPVPVKYFEWLIVRKDQLEREAKQTHLLYVDVQDRLDAIHTALDGKEWDSDTTTEIAQILEGAGYSIGDPDDE